MYKAHKSATKAHNLPLKRTITRAHSTAILSLHRFFKAVLFHYLYNTGKLKTAKTLFIGNHYTGMLMALAFKQNSNS